jgi:hypothetical protein
MKKKTRCENSQGESRKLTEKLKSFLGMKGCCQLHAKNVGSKEDGSERPSSTLLYDSIYECPLSVYIDVTVDDKLNRLVIAGNPSIEELEEAKLKLITDFNEVASGGEMRAYIEAARNYYRLRSLITGLELSLRLIVSGRFDAAVDYLNKNDVPCSVPESEDDLKALIRKVQMKMKNRMAKLKEAESRYRALSSKGGDKPTRRYYNRLLIMLSTCEIIKMQLNPKTLTVAEFAEYLNVFNEYQNHLKIKKYGKH